jgi:intracellular multiplication protein IcmO
MDYSNPYPGRSKFKKAGGIFYVGNEIGTNKELWLTAEDVLTHMMILGTTGAGKSETMVALAYNALAMGSGMFYIDPKAAPKLAHQMFALCRIVGRDDDFKVQNFATDKRPDKQARRPGRQTNTTNPFNQGTADQLTQLLTGLLPKSEGSNAVFGQNAQALITGLLYVLVELRDRGELELSIETIRYYLDVYKCDELARRKDLTDTARQALTSAMGSFGWNEKAPLANQTKVPEQFGFARSYFGQPLANLADSYGHLYMTPYGEVDMEDVILQRRVLIVLLPALEMAPQQLESLGKICLSAVKNACAVGLGSKIEGSNEEILESLPVDSPVPFLSITDEYAAITTPGYAEVFTQGRGLGIGGLLGSQDYGGIAGKDQTGAKQFVANTKVKLFMCQEDAQDTQDLISKLGGKGAGLRTEGYSVDHHTGSSAYQDKLNATIAEVERMPFEDLNRQIEGEFIAFFKSNIIRGNAFYTDLKLKGGQLRIGMMVKVRKPNATRLSMQRGALKELTDNLMVSISQGVPLDYRGEKLPQGAQIIAKQLIAANAPFQTPFRLGRQEQAICALMAYGAQQRKGIRGFVSGGLSMKEPSNILPATNESIVELGIIDSAIESISNPAPTETPKAHPAAVETNTPPQDQEGITEKLPSPVRNKYRIEQIEPKAEALPTTSSDNILGSESFVGGPSLNLLKQAWGEDSEVIAPPLDDETEELIEKQLAYPVAPTPSKEEEGAMIDQLSLAIDRLVNG